MQEVTLRCMARFCNKDKRQPQWACAWTFSFQMEHNSFQWISWKQNILECLESRFSSKEYEASLELSNSIQRYHKCKYNTEKIDPDESHFQIICRYSIYHHWYNCGNSNSSWMLRWRPSRSRVASGNLRNGGTRQFVIHPSVRISVCLEHMGWTKLLASNMVHWCLYE